MPTCVLRAIISVAMAACFITGNGTFAAPLVVETDPLTPEEQRLKFHLPPGFEIQLILSEPDIGQPMNLSFDAAGRLWVTSSVEYPYPARGDGVQDRPERFGAIGDHDPRGVVHMCGSGVTACHNLLAMEHAGLAGSRVFAPSWSGWVDDRSRPVATGD